MKNDTVDNDKTFRALMGQLELLAESPHVDVGFFAGAKNDSGEGEPTSIAEYMYINEMGTATIPARPVVAQTTEVERNGETGDIIKEQFNRIASGTSTVKKALTLVGVHFKGRLQMAIHDYATPENAPATVEKKGANNPLVDTGTAANAVMFEVKGV